MAKISEHVNVQTLLETAVALRAGFGLNCFLVNDDLIPVDMRYRLTTKASYAADFPELSGKPFLFSQTYFGQSITPSQLMVARHIAADTSPFFTFGPSYESTASIWAAIADGVCTVSDGTNTDDLGPIDFGSATSMANVLTLLTADMQAIAVPNIANLDTAVFRDDGTGRIILEHSPLVAGSSAVNLSIGAGGVGTDLVPLMDATNGTSVVGYDQETLTESVVALQAVTGGDDFYNLNIEFLESPATTTEQLALAQYIEATEKLLDIETDYPSALTTSDTTSIGAQVKALGLNRTMCIFTEHTDQYVAAAVIGRTLPLDEGSASFAYQTLANVTASGDANPLNTTEKTNLRANGYNYIETVGTETYMYNGLTCGGEEKRIMLGRDWFNARIQEAIFADMLNDDIHAFDNPTIAKAESHIMDFGEEAIDRNILNNTDERPFIVTLPDADDIAAAVRATHTFTDSDAFLGYINAAINDYAITGKWQL